MKRGLSLLLAGAVLASSLIIFSGCPEGHSRSYHRNPPVIYHVPQKRYHSPKYRAPVLKHHRRHR